VTNTQVKGKWLLYIQNHELRRIIFHTCFSLHECALIDIIIWKKMYLFLHMAHSTITLPEFLFPSQNAKKLFVTSVLNTFFQTTKNTSNCCKKIRGNRNKMLLFPPNYFGLLYVMLYLL